MPFFSSPKYAIKFYYYVMLDFVKSKYYKGMFADGT
jgi:hypothetical protein